MAADYDISFNSPMQGALLVEEVLKHVGLEYAHVANEKVPVFRVDEAGIFIYVLDSFSLECEIKGNRYSFSKALTIAQLKNFPDDLPRRKSILEIVLCMSKAYNTELAFLFNGDLPILLCDKCGNIKINQDAGFWDHEAGKIMERSHYLKASFTENDFTVLR